VTGAGRVAATVRLAAWSAALVLAARVLVATGRGALAIPLDSADDLAAWVGVASPAEMAMAVLRLLAIAACGYLLAVTSLGVGCRVVRARGLAAAVDRITPAVVRRLVSGGTGAGLVLGTLVASLPPPDLPGSPDASTVAAGPIAPEARPSPAGAVTATMARLPPATATMTRTAPPGAASAASATGGEATMTRLEDASAPSATMTSVAPEPASDATPPAPVPVSPAAALPPAPTLPTVDATAWLVEPGDSLWSIAEEVVRTARPEASDDVVTRYWHALTEANRSTLVDPGNPDLLVPGQQLTLPPFTG